MTITHGKDQDGIKSFAYCTSFIRWKNTIMNAKCGMLHSKNPPTFRRLMREVNPRDYLPDVFALIGCHCNFKLGRLASTSGTSESTSAPWRSWEATGD
jgi:hypothetical protein